MPNAIVDNSVRCAHFVPHLHVETIRQMFPQEEGFGETWFPNRSGDESAGAGGAWLIIRILLNTFRIKPGILWRIGWGDGLRRWAAESPTEYSERATWQQLRAAGDASNAAGEKHIREVGPPPAEHPSSTNRLDTGGKRV